MPTTIPLVSRNVNAGLLRGDIAAITSNPDFIFVAAVAAIGLFLTIGFASFFPFSAGIAALATVS